MPKPLMVSVSNVRSAMAGPSMARFIAALGATDADRDKKIAECIRDAQADFETECRVHLFATRIVTSNASAGLTRRTANAEGDYDKLDSPFTYYKDDFTGGPITVQLRKRPVLSIQSAGLRWGSAPLEGDLLKFPADYITPMAREGTLTIMALFGGKAMLRGDGVLMLPVLGAIMRGAAVPALLAINYTAGFLPRTFNPDTDDIDDACPDFEEIRVVAHGVRSLAALMVMKKVRLAKGAGGGNIAIDGISQNHQAGRFAQEIQDMADDVAKAKTTLTGAMGGNFSFMVQ